MKISATSALVLNWTAPDVWQSEEAKLYTQGLDLSEGDELLSIFTEDEHYMHLQAVSNRKFFVRKHALHFMKDCAVKGLKPQVIILGAGIAPLSIELAAYSSDVKIFDVDKYLMEEKSGYLNRKFPQISFLTCDITDVVALEQQLSNAGWERNSPTLVIMEGIIYYLAKEACAAILSFFARCKAALAADFALMPAMVDERARDYGTEVFRKISDRIGLSHIQFYSPGDFSQMLAASGFQLRQRSLLSEIQQEFRGSPLPFEGAEPGWISLVYATS